MTHTRPGPPPGAGVPVAAELFGALDFGVLAIGAGVGAGAGAGVAAGAGELADPFAAFVFVAGVPAANQVWIPLCPRHAPDFDAALV